MSIHVLTVKKSKVKPSAKNPSGKIVFLRLVEDQNFNLSDYDSAKKHYIDSGYDSVVIAKAIQLLPVDATPVKGKIYIRQRRDRLGMPLTLARYLGTYFDSSFKCDYEKWEMLKAPHANPKESDCIVSMPCGLDDIPVPIAEAIY